MISPITEKQFDRVRTRYPAAAISPLPSGSALVTIPAIALPQGWSAAETAIHFIVPIGYPGPAPDCFWADASLLLATRAAPQASNVQPIPESNIQARWFSWHVVDAQNNWNPNRDDLMTYVAIILDRFRHPQ
jgi:Prokaryotic E2 family E